jgi:hypothetical protein
MHAGQLVAHGPSTRVVDKYNAEASAGGWGHLPVANPPAPVRQAAPAAAATPGSAHAQRPPSEPSDVEITAVRVVGPSGSAVSEFDTGSALGLEIDFIARKPLKVLNFAVRLFRDDGLSVFDLCTDTTASSLSDVSGEGQVVLHIEQLDLAGAAYFVEVQAFGDDAAAIFDSRKGTQAVTIRPTSGTRGVILPPHRWDVRCPAGDQTS